MKFKVAQEPLLSRVSKVAAVVPSRTPLTFLYNIHAVLKGNELNLTASDGDVFLITKVEVEGVEEGSVLVPAKPLQDLLRELPQEEIEFETTAEHHLLIKTTKGEFTIPGEDPSRFPSAPTDKPPQKISFTSENLRTILDQTAFAISQDELRPALTGLLLQFKSDEMRAVSTDGHRLVKLVKDRPGSSTDSAIDEVEVIVPLRTLNLLQRNLDDAKEINVYLATNRVVIETGELVITSKVIEGKFPAYDAVIPQDNPNHLEVEIEKLSSAIRRVSIFANQINKLVVLDLSAEGLKVSAEDPDSGRKGQEELEGKYEGEALKIGYNAQYLLEALRHVPGSTIDLRFGSSTSAGVMVPTSNEEGVDLLMLLMPIRLQ